MKAIKPHHVSIVLLLAALIAISYGDCEALNTTVQSLGNDGPTPGGPQTADFESTEQEHASSAGLATCRNLAQLLISDKIANRRRNDLAQLIYNLGMTRSLWTDHQAGAYQILSSSNFVRDAAAYIEKIRALF